MRLLMNYKGINKIIPKVESYANIVKFIHQNFYLKLSKWNLYYIDSDGDQISLDSELDVQTMMETITKDHLKVYIKDAEENQKPKVQEKAQEISKGPVTLLQSPFDQSKESQPLLETKVDQIQPRIIEAQGAKPQHCRWKKQWRQKMEAKMAKFVDERVQNLLPCLIQKIQAKINKTELNSERKQVGVKHEVKCTGCDLQPIYGIRYKCVQCPNFNFCENCEANLPHDHNMIKMRFIEAEPKKEEQFGGHHWKHWRRGHSHHHHHGSGHHHPHPHPHHESGHHNQPHHWPHHSHSPFIPEHGAQCHDAFNNMSGSQCRFQRKHDGHEPDMLLKLTKKCFRMSNFFGGSPDDYREFVEKNIDLKFKQLSQLYMSIHKNGEFSSIGQEKIKQKLQKLAFYFKEPKENFKPELFKNPCLNLKELIEVIKKNKATSTENLAKVEIPEEQKQSLKPQSPIQIKKQVPVQAPKTLTKQSVEQKTEDKASYFSNLIPQGLNLWGRKQVDTKKRNQFIVAMKQLFGAQDVFTYIKFYDQHTNLEYEQIIALYIDKRNSASN